MESLDDDAFYIMTAQGKVERVNTIQEAIQKTAPAIYAISTRYPSYARDIWAMGRNITEALWNLAHIPACPENIEAAINKLQSMDFMSWEVRPATERLYTYFTTFPEHPPWISPECTDNENGFADLVAS